MKIFTFIFLILFHISIFAQNNCEDLFIGMQILDSMTIRSSHVSNDPNFSPYMMREIMRIADDVKRMDEVPDLGTVLDRIAMRRKSYALENPSRYRVEIYRQVDARTGKIYYRKGIVSPITESSSYWLSRIEKILEEKEETTRKEKGTPLTNIVTSRSMGLDKIPLYTGAKYWLIHPQGQEIINLELMAAEIFNRFKEKMNTKGISRRELMSLIAEVHFLLANATIFTRGSASIADGISKVMMLMAGIEIRGYRLNISPDMESFLLSKEEFINQYPSFFEP